MDRAEEAARYIARDAPIAARKWLVTLFDKVKNLESFSRLGRMVPEIEREPIRELFFGSYRIVYRVEERRVIILTVRHARQPMDAKEIDTAFPPLDA